MMNIAKPFAPFICAASATNLSMNHSLKSFNTLPASAPIMWTRFQLMKFNIMPTSRAASTNKRPPLLQAQPVSKNTWRVTVVGYDYPGELSIICGLFFVFGFNILDGNAFTYEPLPDSPAASRSQTFNRFDPTRRLPPRRRASSTPEPDTRRKIVDVFTVKSILSKPPD